MKQLRSWPSSATFPIWSGRRGFAIEEFARRRGDFAVAAAVVAVELDDVDRIRRCAIGLIGLGSTPLRAATAEAEIAGRETDDVVPDELGRLATGELTDVISDLHGSSDYRKRVGAAMVARAWTAASEEARHA